MKKTLLVIIPLSLAALFFSSCTSPTQPKGGGGTPQPSTIRGVVIRSDDQSKVPNAIVYDTRATAPQDTTKSDGSFKLTYQLTSSYSGSLVASRTTFGSDTINFTLAQGANDSLPRALVLKADTSSQKTAAGTGVVASIVLVGGGEVSSIAIRGTGFTESALLTFEARDSLGIPVGGVNKSTMYFSLLGDSAVAGGAYVFPRSGLTDLAGRVSTRVTSGTKAGVVQVFAFVRPDTSNPSYIVKSSPVRLTISGGLPDSAHFSMGVQTFNIAGMLFDNLRDNVSVIIGDNQGNPVHAGTAVYFSTNAGIIQPSATTDANGSASVTLISGNPRPTTTGGRVTITATTIGDNGKIVRQSAQIIFSGATKITPPAGNFTIPDSGSYSFSYTVADAYGNPIVGKSTIVVSVSGPGSGDLELSGDANVTMPDALFPGLGTTQFSVKLRDKSRGGANGLVYVTIKVSTDAANGNGNASTTFAGYQFSSGGGGGGGFGVLQPSSITLSSLSPSSGNLAVRGTGSSESARLTFMVRDSAGNPISDPLGVAPKVYVTFTSSPNLGGGEFIYPTADSTDALGQVTTNFNAGTKSGVIQVTAQTIAGTKVIQAAPVNITISGGLPDSNHFTATLSKINMPGLVKTGTLGTVNVLVGDFAGNPAQAGTKLYFSTTGGVISAAAVTDANGQATATIQGGVPAPNDLGPGRGLVTIKTVGVGGVSISKQLPFLFSGSPVIAGPSSGFLIADSGQYNFAFKVADLNGNPLSGGTTIAVTASGAGSGSLSLKGDAARTLPDTKDTSFTSFSVLAQDNSGPAGSVTFTISVAGDNGTASYSWSGTKLAKGAVVGGGGAGYAASIQLLSASPAAPGPISVKGTGSSETAILLFQVKDSLGNSLDPTRAADINFSIQNGPGGGEFLYPASAKTNSSGQVTTTLNAGTKSGVVQVVASTTLGAVTIKSSPVQMVIASGLADSNHFSVWASGTYLTNTPVASTTMFQLPVANINVLAGDRYGNPAQNTAVYFTTNGGIIKASAQTDAGGSISNISLLGGNPLPPGGIDTVTVSTAGENGQNIVRRLVFTGSGNTLLTFPSVPSGTIPAISDGGYALFYADIKDANGNPIAVGNSVAVTIGGDQTVVSQLAVTIDGKASPVSTVDTRDTSTVHYLIKVTDGQSGGGTGGAYTLTFTITGPNGTAIHALSGYLQAPGTVSGGGGGGTGFAGSIALQSVMNNGVAINTVSVKGTGSNETAVVRFVVKDSLGNPVDLAHAAAVQFAILNPLGGGETLSPTSATTDASGQVATTLTAGTISGPISIQARIVGPPQILSAPVPLTIASGLPDLSHFTLWVTTPSEAPVSNVPGMVSGGNKVANVHVLVGDLYGNPVQTGTAVYFTTNGGVVTSSGYTDETGHEKIPGVTLYGGSPTPPGGNATITASTISAGGGTISRQITLTYSGAPVLSVPAYPSGTLPALTDGGFLSFTFDVKDVNNNPVAAGNVISISATGDPSVTSQLGFSINGTGTSAVAIADTRDTSKVHYQLKITDNSAGAGSGGAFTVAIAVNGPYNSASKSFTGFLQAPGVIVGGGGGTGYTSSIILSSVSATDISVQGTGSSETATLVFQAQDSLGQVVDQAHGSMMHFTISPPTLGATLTVDSVQTDASGRATTLVRSGTIAGVIQVKATAKVPSGLTISSLPVRLSINSGLPDQNHFSIAPARYNFPGLRFNGLTDAITIQMGDAYGNPVQTGTVAYFTTNHGVIQTTGSTSSSDGFITKTLFSGNPRPEGAFAIAAGNGYSYVTASTYAPNGTVVHDSVQLLWTGPPIITRITGNAAFSIPKGGTLGGWTFTVADLYGHPMSAGTTIAVTADAGSVSGNFGTLPDTKSSGPGLTSFSIVVTNSHAVGGTDPAVASQVMVSVNHPVYGVYTLILDTGTMQ